MEDQCDNRYHDNPKYFSKASNIIREFISLDGGGRWNGEDDKGKQGRKPKWDDDGGSRPQAERTKHFY